MKTFTANGKGELYVVTNRRFQDVSPITMCKVEVFNLDETKKPEKRILE